jgi:hypothetical protein
MRITCDHCGLNEAHTPQCDLAIRLRRIRQPTARQPGLLASVAASAAICSMTRATSGVIGTLPLSQRRQ